MVISQGEFRQHTIPKRVLHGSVFPASNLGIVRIAGFIIPFDWLTLTHHDPPARKSTHLSPVLKLPREHQSFVHQALNV